MTHNFDYQTPPTSKLMRFFWKACGADKNILEKATYSDHIKYVCLGGIIIATGVMAGLAGGYAFYTIFSPKTSDVLSKMKVTEFNESYIPTDIPTVILSIIFGLIWGLIIFNIDRFIVTSTGKGDGTEAITWEEFKGAIPRIVMGLIIAVTISKPVEIRMFKTEIDLEIAKEQRLEKQRGIDDAAINYKKKVSEAETKRGKLQNEINDLEKSVSNLRMEVSNEITGKNGNKANYGPRAKELERQAEILELKINTLKLTPEYIKSLEEIANYNEEKNSEIKESEQKAATLDGLLIRIQKLHEKAPWISLFITLLFMAIELTPIFFKLMLIKSPYDYMEENIKDLVKAENGIEVKYDYYMDKKGMERNLIINHNALNMNYEKSKLSEAHQELTDYAVQKYKEREMKKIDENLDTYIKPMS